MRNFGVACSGLDLGWLGLGQSLRGLGGCGLVWGLRVQAGGFQWASGSGRMLKADPPKSPKTLEVLKAQIQSPEGP